MKDGGQQGPRTQGAAGTGDCGHKARRVPETADPRCGGYRGLRMPGVTGMNGQKDHIQEKCGRGEAGQSGNGRGPEETRGLEAVSGPGRPGGPGEVLLRASHIVKDFSLGEVTVHALRDVSFEIFDRELIVILGPSGSGKSTMMNIIGGIETPTSGEVYYRGERLPAGDEAAMTAFRREHIGFVFQFYNLLPGLTALENVALAGELGRDPLDAGQLLSEVGLSDRADHFPNRLSGGQQQRVAIARALCKNPDLLLCDEPTGALDSESGSQVLRLLHHFCRHYGKPVILITHNQSIARMADRVFFFRDGRLERIGVNACPEDPEEIDW